jgi:hypothetical protein
MYGDNTIFTLMKKYRDELLIAIGGVLLFILTLFLSPIADDWAYMTSPTIRTFSLARYRRLCDVLIGMFLQSHPAWFPMLNRVLIVVSHTICALLFYKIAANVLKVKAAISLFFSLVFLIGGNTITTVINYDCFNQTGSLMAGAAGIYFFLKASGIRKKFIVYFVFCVLALCVKESGIVYFAIIPLFGVIKDIVDDRFDAKTAVKTLSAFYIPGIVCALAYYFSPIIQSEKLWVYGNENSNTPLRYLLGICMRLVFSYSRADQVALFRFRAAASLDTFLIVLTTVVLSMPILIVSLVVIVNFLRKKDIRFLGFLFLVAESIIVFTPTLLSSPTGNLHNYNCNVFFAEFVFCFILNTVNRRTVIASATAFLLASLITTADIYTQDYQTTVRQDKAIRNLKAALVKEEIKTYIVYNLNTLHEKTGTIYPVTLYNMQQIFDLGGDLMPVFGYGAQCSRINLCNEKFIYKGNSGVTPTYLDLSDAALLQYAQEEARNAVNSGLFDVALVLLPTDEFYLYQ